MGHSFDTRRGNARTWLPAVVHHKAIDTRRRHRGQLPEDLSLELEQPPLESADIWHQVANRLDREALGKALAQIPDSQREAIAVSVLRKLMLAVPGIATPTLGD